MKLQKILSAVANVTGLSEKYIVSVRKTNEAVYARSAFMIIADELDIYTQEAIENYVNRSHGALRAAYQRAWYSEIAEILRKTKTLLREGKRSLKRNNISCTEKKKFSVPEIFFLTSKSEIVMLTVKRYNNRVAIYDTLNNYTKIMDKRVRFEIITFYRTSGKYAEMPYSKLRTEKKKLRLPAVQTQLFNQMEFNF